MEDVQATPTQTQLPPSPNQPNTSQSQSITNARTQPCPNSQFVQHPAWVALAPGPTKDATTAPTMIQTDGDKLSTGEMNKFRPFPQQSLRLSCITDDVRSNTVARFYRLLKSKNPPRTASGCHLSDNQMIEAACGAEIQILVLMEEDIREKNLSPSRLSITQKYLHRRRTMWQEYKDGGSFWDLICGLEKGVLEKMKQVRQFMRQQVHQQLHRSVSPVRGRVRRRRQS